MTPEGVLISILNNSTLTASRTPADAYGCRQVYMNVIKGTPAEIYGSRSVYCYRKEKIMPGGDRTGPLGIGPGSGWGRGVCGAPGGRRGFGSGFANYRTSYMRGYGNLSGAELETLQILKKELEEARADVVRLQKRISEIQKEN